jgi:hypothetical protein
MSLFTLNSHSLFLNPILAPNFIREQNDTATVENILVVTQEVK